MANRNWCSLTAPTTMLVVAAIDDEAVGILCSVVLWVAACPSSNRKAGSLWGSSYRYENMHLFTVLGLYLSACSAFKSQTIPCVLIESILTNNICTHRLYMRTVHEMHLNPLLLRRTWHIMMCAHIHIHTGYLYEIICKQNVNEANRPRWPVCEQAGALHGAHNFVCKY